MIIHRLLFCSAFFKYVHCENKVKVKGLFHCYFSLFSISTLLFPFVVIVMLVSLVWHCGELTVKLLHV